MCVCMCVCVCGCVCVCVCVREREKACVCGMCSPPSLASLQIELLKLFNSRTCQLLLGAGMSNSSILQFRCLIFNGKALKQTG